MGQAKARARAKAAGLPTPHREPKIAGPPTEIKAAVIGFVPRQSCKRCYGRGFLGYDSRYHDLQHVIPCVCIEFFDLSKIQESYERAQKKVDEFREKQEATKCGTTSPAENSSSLSALEPSNSSSS